MSSGQDAFWSKRDPDLFGSGTPIGVVSQIEAPRPVYIPLSMRSRSVHLVGACGSGKSTLMEAMILDDVRRGNGVAVLDPHGGLTRKVACLLAGQDLERAIYMDVSDADWVVRWNPLRCDGNESRSRTADDIVRAFKGLSCDWKDCIEHLLRQAVYAVLHVPNGSLLDVSNLLRKESVESRQLRKTFSGLTDNESSRIFWRDDFDRYSRADLLAAQYKLSRLLACEPVGAMLSQGDSAFSFREVMDTGKVLLVDLSGIGPQVRDTLGRLILCLLHLAALERRGDREHSHRPFHVYCDDAQVFMADEIEDLIAEAPMAGVSLTLAHQCMCQLGTHQANAVSAVGSTIIFRVLARDAEQFQKGLKGKASVEDLISLGVGQAIARVGNHVVPVTTNPPQVIPEHHHRDEIIDRSHRLYCRPINDVIRAVRGRNPGDESAPAT